jgi:hypothetical protein
MSETDDAVSRRAQRNCAAYNSCPEERTGVTELPSRNPAALTHTQRMWGFSLADTLPRVLTRDGITAVAGEFARMGRFLASEFGMFHEEALRSDAVAQDYIVCNRKSEYLRDACDLIELRHADNTIGVLMGAPEDWSTYYVRIFALHRSFQRPAMTRLFIRDCLFDPLAEHGVERISADTSPANIAMSRLFTELHFHVTGSQLSDRWGPLVRYTRFLSPACEAEFRRKFGGGAPADSPRKSDKEAL